MIMKKKQTLLSLRKQNNEAGFTLLEYTAGAAVLLVLVMAGLQAFGGGLNTLFTGLGTWSTEQAAQLPPPVQP